MQSVVRPKKLAELVMKALQNTNVGLTLQQIGEIAAAQNYTSGDVNTILENGALFGVIKKMRGKYQVGSMFTAEGFRRRRRRRGRSPRRHSRRGSRRRGIRGGRRGASPKGRRRAAGDGKEDETKVATERQTLIS